MRFSAISKLDRVRVEDSKKRFTTVLPRRVGTFLMGRSETSRLSYSMDAVAEFEDFVEDMYDFADVQELQVDTLIHENGAAQMEINFLHGDALNLADQVFAFKRTVRETAHKHNIYATFMAKPMQKEPGSAMHIHQSVVDKTSGKTIFGADGDVFDSGLERGTGIARGYENFFNLCRLGRFPGQCMFAATAADN